jgi:hypothetical protein
MYRLENRRFVYPFLFCPYAHLILVFVDEQQFPLDTEIDKCEFSVD